MQEIIKQTQSQLLEYLQSSEEGRHQTHQSQIMCDACYESGRTECLENIGQVGGTEE